jgi:hypothetical protein
MANEILGLAEVGELKIQMFEFNTNSERNYKLFGGLQKDGAQITRTVGHRHSFGNTDVL